MSETEKMHKGLPVLGYTAQSDEKILLVNASKLLEARILAYLDTLKDKTDPRWLAIARTDLEKAFMSLNRAIF